MNRQAWAVPTHSMTNTSDNDQTWFTLDHLEQTNTSREDEHKHNWQSRVEWSPTECQDYMQIYNNAITWPRTDWQLTIETLINKRTQTIGKSWPAKHDGQRQTNSNREHTMTRYEGRTDNGQSKRWSTCGLKQSVSRDPPSMMDNDRRTTTENTQVTTLAIQNLT